MIETQLAWVASKQNRVDEALAHVKRARALLAAAPTNAANSPPVFDAIEADVYVRAHRWVEAIAPARRCTERAPKNSAAWAVYARALVAAAKTKPEFATALDAATRGLELAPRDPDLLRSQATALVGLRDPRAKEAQAAYTRFRSPDEAPGLRIRCAHKSESCARDRNPVHTLPLRPER
jgi:predicted Zn-dependent protease